MEYEYIFVRIDILEKSLSLLTLENLIFFIIFISVSHSSKKWYLKTRPNWQHDQFNLLSLWFIIYTLDIHTYEVWL